MDVDKTGWLATDGQPEQPVLHLYFDGPRPRLKELLTSRLREDIRPDEIDVTFRFVSPTSEADTGVFSLSDRVTGDFILECEGKADSIRTFVRGVGEYANRSGRDARYEVQIRADTGVVASFEKELLLVYNADGTLLRHASLIPSSVEM
ncbi:hypothetical protein HZS54_12680 [Halosimplex pelagicum]|uniref:Uncharacterized protein n=2 Tax=Halosimplex pelagicum TaxID=869886 RepID=A0A7D5PCL5_9EURY|nr:hypothetical protein HZS54_12680 [Halosimplex pelagicum]